MIRENESTVCSRAMKREDFNYKQHGFTGHLAEPDEGTDRAVIVIREESRVFSPELK